MIKQEALESAINLMELEFYRVKRYKTSMSVAIIESKCNNLFNKVIEETIRTSDLYQYMDNHRFFVIFDHTNADGAKKAIDKILEKAKESCDENIYIGYSEVNKEDRESSDTIKRVEQALHEAKQLGNENIINL